MDAAVFRDRRIEQGQVTLDRLRHRLSVPLPEARAALDIGEEEGDGPGGELGHRTGSIGCI
jgi:hypothetical protein